MGHYGIKREKVQKGRLATKQHAKDENCRAVFINFLLDWRDCWCVCNGIEGTNWRYNLSPNRRYNWSKEKGPVANATEPGKVGMFVSINQQI